MSVLPRVLIVSAIFAVGLLIAGCAGAAPPRPEPGDLEYDPTIAPMAEDDDAWADWDKHGPRWIRTTIASYFKNRFLDFMDMFEMGLTGGRIARVQADYLIGFWGLGSTDCQRWRLGQRSAILNEETTTVSIIPFPASVILFPAMLTDDPDAKVKGTILTLGGISYEREEAIWPDPVFSGTPDTRERIRMAFLERDRQTHRFELAPDSFTIGLEAHLLVGVRARVMPLQILDFAAGILGWDMLKDDVRVYDPESWQAKRTE